MDVFVLLHMVKDILAKASKKGVSSLYIPLLVVNLIALKVGIQSHSDYCCWSNELSGLSKLRPVTTKPVSGQSFDPSFTSNSKYFVNEVDFYRS